MILESVLGGLFGGLLRLAPELLKFFDRKDERKHEALMFDKEIEIAQARLDAQMHRDVTQLDIASIDAIATASREQGETSRAAGKVVSAISALVRPIVTYWFVFLYSAVKLAGMYLMYVNQDYSLAETLQHSWTKDDMGILSMILVFWFVGRVYEGIRKQ